LPSASTGTIHCPDFASVSGRLAKTPPGWTRVRVQAASLNHRDIWSLRGAGLPPERLPMILGSDAAGHDEDGQPVVVHAVIADPAAADPSLRERETKLAAATDEAERTHPRIELTAQRAAVRSAKLGEVAAEFEAIHNIQRAQRVGSVHTIIPAAQLRPSPIAAVERGLAKATTAAAPSQ
jgi:hypothetical protein